MQISSYIFSPRLIPTLLAIICIPTLISLGLWQLDRANEKRVIDQDVNDSINKPALVLNSADLTKLSNEIYRTTSVNGEYDTKQQFLLDNRTHKGQPGYHIFSPFLFEHSSKLKPEPSSANNMRKHAVLVNRGWIGYKGTRDKIQDISLNQELTKIVGAIKKVPRSIVLKDKTEDNLSTAFIFKTNKQQLEGVSLIQSIQLNRLEKTLNYELLPVIIELAKTEKNGFTREWQPYYGSIDKHKAYALQWFAMATILLFLFIKLNLRKP